MAKELDRKPTEKKSVTNGGGRESVWDNPDCCYSKQLIKEAIVSLTDRTMKYSCFWDRVPMLSPVLQDMAVDAFLKKMGIKELGNVKAEMYSVASVPNNDGCLIVANTGSGFVLGVQQKFGAPMQNFYSDEFRHEISDLYGAAKLSVRMQEQEPSDVYTFFRKIGLE